MRTAPPWRGFFMNTTELYKLLKASTGVSTDTRNIKDGSIFFALKGANFDGNLFARRALDSGSAFAVIDDPYSKENDRYILVDSVIETLQKLATYHRSQLTIPVIAITGSNGKTTTKELLKVALEKKFKVAATKGNLNNHIGVPLTLLEVSSEHEIALVELGDNHVGEVDFLCQLSKPSLGFVTNVGKDHLEGFGSMENNIKAKKEIFDYLAQTKGTAFVNEQDDLVESMSRACDSRVLFGKGKREPKLLSANPFVTYLNEDGETIRTHLAGHFNFDNILLSWKISRYFGVESGEIHKALANYEPDNNRSQWIQTRRNIILMDAYNANPSSMKLALEHFFSLDHTFQKLIILGDMFELGPFSSSEHQSIVNLIETAPINEAWLVGDHFLNTKRTKKFRAFKSIDQLKASLHESPVQKRLILLKGSRGIQLEKLLEHF